MKIKVFFTTLLFLAAGLLIAAGIEDSKPLYTDYDVKRSVIELNTSITASGFNTIFSEHALSEDEKIAAVEAFTRGARFFPDKSGYLFMKTLAGVTVAHPERPELERDAEITEKMNLIAEFTGSGFLKYRIEDPADGMTRSKITAVHALRFEPWYAGAGFYERSEDKTLYTPLEKNRILIKEAVTMVAGGIGAVYALLEPNPKHIVYLRSFLRNIRFFDNQSGYFFVIDYKGINRVQPPDPSLQGVDEWDVTDSRGNFLVRNLIETAQNGGGYSRYYWIDYETGIETLKTVYVSNIPGTDLLIGSGMYNKN